MNRNIQAAGITAIILAAFSLPQRACANQWTDILQDVVGNRTSAQPYYGNNREQPYTTVYSNDYRNGNNYYGHDGSAEIEQQLQSAASRINRGRASGQLSPGESNQLRRTLDNLRLQAENMHRSGNGINQWEQGQLRESLANLNTRITNELNDRRQEAYRGTYYRQDHSGYNNGGRVYSQYDHGNAHDGNTVLWY